MIYGVWYLFIGFTALALIALTVSIILYAIGTMYDTFLGVCIISCIACFIASFITLLVSIIQPINAHKEIIYMVEMYSTYQGYADIIAKDSPLDGNFAQNSTYLETLYNYNSKISDIKASKETWGIFSPYFAEDVSVLNVVTFGD